MGLVGIWNTRLRHHPLWGGFVIVWDPAMLTHHEWYVFGSGGGPSIVRVCKLSKALVAALGANTPYVQCKQGYAAKMRFKHRIPAQEMYLLPIIIEHGIVLRLSAISLAFHYWHSGQSAWYEVVIKVTKKRHEIWVATFHRQKIPEIRRRQRKYRQIAR
jgi:hypothetical protein